MLQIGNSFNYQSSQNTSLYIIQREGGVFEMGGS